MKYRDTKTGVIIEILLKPADGQRELEGVPTYWEWLRATIGMLECQGLIEKIEEKEGS